MDLIVTASASNRVIALASQARRGRGRVCAGHVRSRSAGGSAKGPGLVDRCASCDSVPASWVGVGQRTSWGSARPLWRDPHEHRARVGVTTEVTQENAALGAGGCDEQVVVEGSCGPCPDL